MFYIDSFTDPINKKIYVLVLLENGERVWITDEQYRNILYYENVMNKLLHTDFSNQNIPDFSEKINYQLEDDEDLFEYTMLNPFRSTRTIIPIHSQVIQPNLYIRQGNKKIPLDMYNRPYTDKIETDSTDTEDELF